MTAKETPEAIITRLRPYRKGRQYPLTSALRALVAVAQEGSITQALNSSDYTLPGMLTSLRKLEASESISLLAQNQEDRRSLTLTPDGERLARWAAEWFTSADWILGELRQSK